MSLKNFKMLISSLQASLISAENISQNMTEHTPLNINNYLQKSSNCCKESGLSHIFSSSVNHSLDILQH